mgnify:CR=1 FL=1
MFKSSLRLSRRDVHWKLSAAKIISEWRRRIKDEAALGYQLPSLFHAFFPADQFEVVDVDAQDKFATSVQEETLPSGYGFEITFQQLFNEMVFPILAAHRMSIQR